MILTADIDLIRRKATNELNQATRSELGQFLTPSNIASFMAGLFTNFDKEIKLLDPGAGIGSLSIAFLNRILLEKRKTKSIELTAYEIDSVLLPYLTKNISAYIEKAEQYNLDFQQNILGSDFIITGVSLLKSGTHPFFTHAILNPPYKKINSASLHRQQLSSIGFETVNLYPAFVALSLLLLKQGGELVAIIPRSFCNGNYYKSFRKLIIQEASIKQIHLFESRNQAFKEDDVLQENIIIHLVKGEKQSDVKISLSKNETLIDFKQRSFPFEKIIKPDDTEFYIHIPDINTSESDYEGVFNDTLKDLGLEISTGPVVDFRVKEHLFMNPTDGTMPLLYPNHFNGKEIDWPKASKKPNSIAYNSETKKMFYPSGYYTLVKRFSSKEEKQRVVARVYNPTLMTSEFIGFENHLNVFHSHKKGISQELAYGLATYLNSPFVDRYFRTFSGHTQVNATDLRQLKYPSRDKLISLGKWAKNQKSFDQEKINEQLMKLQ